MYVARTPYTLLFSIACFGIAVAFSQACSSETETKHEEIVQSEPSETDEDKINSQKTDQQLQLELLKKELEEIRAAEALKAVSDIDVELIQRALNALGFRAGTVNSELGPSTRQAIRRFQYSIVASDSTMSEEEKKAVVTGFLTPLQTIELFKTAANDDHPMSQYVYGIMYARGIGFERDGHEAVKWLEKAAHQKLCIAHYALGVIFRDGMMGPNNIKPDTEESDMHFLEATACGYVDSEHLPFNDFPTQNHPHNDKT